MDALWKPSAVTARTNPPLPILSPPSGGLFLCQCLPQQAQGLLRGYILEGFAITTVAGVQDPRPLGRGQRDKYRTHRLLLRAAGGARYARSS